MSTRRTRFQIVFTDLDGTLLRSDGTVSRLTKHVVHECVGRGVPVVPVTARSSASAGAALRWLRAPVPFICQNGAIGYSPVGGGIYHRTAIPRTAFARLVSELSKSGQIAIADSDDFKWIPPTSLEFAASLPLGPMRDVRSLSDLSSQDAYTVIIARDAHLEARLHHLRAQFPELRFVISSGHTVDVTSALVSKTSALQTICRDFGYELSDAVAVGDSDNDFEMLCDVGLGVAVSNSTERIISIADRVLRRSNDQDAVAHLLIELFDIRTDGSGIAQWS